MGIKSLSEVLLLSAEAPTHSLSETRDLTFGFKLLLCSWAQFMEQQIDTERRGSLSSWLRIYLLAITSGLVANFPSSQVFHHATD